jgi:hypothetical protein
MHMNRTASLLLFILLVIFTGCNNQAPTVTNSGSDKDARESILADDSAVNTSSPLVQAYTEKATAALQSSIPVLPLSQADSSQAQAQRIALADRRFTQNCFDPKTGKACRNEIFNIYAARPQEVPKGYATNKVYRVELYNYALNLTTVGWVDLASSQLIRVSTLPETQPEIPAHLKDMALQIAVNAPEVIKALGYKPGESAALMANTKTALNATKCERSMHLCVAPTFIKGDRALWAIVDLTDHKLVGIRWTSVGETGPAPRISERKLQFDKIMSCNCKTITPLNKDGWKLNYVITSSDGLRISEVYYNNRLIILNAKLVDWHVSYSGTEGFGYSDAAGCPEFSQAAVVAVSEPKVKELEEGGKKLGFVLEQTFRSEQWPRPCNYNYIQRYEFYTDGRFRIACGSLGRGCGNNGTYRPVTRILFAEQQDFAEWNGSSWTAWDREKWQLQNAQTAYTPEGYQYRVGGQKGFYLQPGNGRFGDGGRGDNAFVYVTKYHTDKDEGETDMVTIGPCCNTDYHQGPEKFIEPNPEPLGGSQVVVWYVAQLKNDDRPGFEYCWAESLLDKGVYKTKAYPCMSGPMFIPIR